MGNTYCNYNNQSDKGGIDLNNNKLLCSRLPCNKLQLSMLLNQLTVSKPRRALVKASTNHY